MSFELLGIVGHDAGGSDYILLTQSQRRGAVEQIVQLVQAGVVEGKAEQGVLDNGVIDAVLPALSAQRGVLLNGDALVIHEHAGGSFLDLLSQLGHDGLLFR